MLFTYSFEVAGVQRRFLALARTLQNLDPALRAFGGYMLKRFRAPRSLAPLAASTEERRQARQAQATEAIRAVKLKVMRRKLVRELRRATAKSPGVAAHNRYMVLKEFDRIVAGGSAGVSLLDDKASKSLRGRIGRAGGKASSKVLGRLPSANRAEVKNHTLVAGSIVPWADAQNDGKTVGHGAKLEARTYIEVTSDDVSVLTNLIEDFATWSFAEGAVGSKAKTLLRSR